MTQHLIEKKKRKFNAMQCQQNTPIEIRQSRLNSKPDQKKGEHSSIGTHKKQNRTELVQIFERIKRKIQNATEIECRKNGM